MKDRHPQPLQHPGRIKARYTALSLLCLLLAATSEGQSPTSDLVAVGQNDFQINHGSIDGENGLYHTKLGADWDPLTRKYLMAWEGPVSLPGPILGQVLSASSSPLSPVDLKFGEMDFGVDRKPVVVWNPGKNTFFVSWEQGLYSNIYLQGVNSLGVRTFQSEQIINTRWDSSMPTVAWNSTDHEFLFVWSYYLEVIGWTAIYGRRVTDEGVGIGDSEFQISEVPNPYDPSAFAVYPSVVWNGSKDEYLVVWNGSNEDYTELTNSEIFGKRLTNLGESIGDQFAISNSGSEMQSAYAKVAWNMISNEYLVVWDRGPKSGIGQREIVGQVLADGEPPFTDDSYSISHSIIGGSTDFDASFPDIVWNEGSNEYLVVWSADQVSREEFEIYGRRLNAQGEVIGENNIRISDMGPDGDNRFDAYYPVVAANPEDQEYLVAWKGDDDSNGLVDDQFGIFGQRLGYVPAPTPTLVNPRSDINGDGTVDANDLMLLLGDWKKSEAHEAGR